MQDKPGSDTGMSRRAAILGVLTWTLAGCSGLAHANKTTAGAVPRQEIKMIVIEEARRIGVPVPLALAMAHAESSFNAGAESHKGARGVMQIMPATARGEYGLSPDLLWEPRINVRVGLHFMKRLLRRYRGRIDLALSYYNGGSAVGDFPNARVIPATARYVARVQQLQLRYGEELGRELS
jgi:soluble lytic murein transglycosylase-like protein